MVKGKHKKLKFKKKIKKKIAKKPSIQEKEVEHDEEEVVNIPRIDDKIARDLEYKRYTEILKECQLNRNLGQKKRVTFLIS